MTECEYTAEGIIGKVGFRYDIKTKKDRATFRKDIRALMKGVDVTEHPTYTSAMTRLERKTKELELLKKKNVELQSLVKNTRKLQIADLIHAMIRREVNWITRDIVKEEIDKAMMEQKHEGAVCSCGWKGKKEDVADHLQGVNHD